MAMNSDRDRRAPGDPDAADASSPQGRHPERGDVPEYGNDETLHRTDRLGNGGRQHERPNAIGIGILIPR
jgi:hypothetical protein